MKLELDPYESIEAWKWFVAERPMLAESNPYASAPLTPRSVFLYASSTSPLPCAAHAGFWFSYPDIPQMVNHLRYVVLPDMWSTWLCRDEWDDDYDSMSLDPIALPALFEGARAAEIRYAADIPRMEAIVKLLDEGTWAALEQAVTLFNERWARTSTWDFTLQLFSSITEMGQHLYERDGCSSACSYEEDEWAALCGRAVADPEASDTVLAILQDACAC